MLHLRTRFFAALERILGLEWRKKVYKLILHKKFIVIKGTIRDTNDYDDAWLLALAHESKHIYDVGCNIGQSSLLLLFPDNVESILLVEPNPLALSVCAENLILNGLSHKARFVCAFASNEPGNSIDFFTVGTGAAGSMYQQHAVTASNVGSLIKVDTTTLDSLYHQYKILPDLVKIDVEGAEIFVLQGAREIAAQKKTRFLVEMHSSPELHMGDNAIQIIEWCESNMYNAWYLKDKTILKESHQIAHRGEMPLAFASIWIDSTYLLKIFESR